MPGAALAFADPDIYEVEYVAPGGGMWRGPLSGCWAVRFEDVAPVRSFAMRRGPANFPGWRWVATSGRHVGYESWLERDHVTVLDFDPAVVGMCSQPFWLHWHDGRRRRRHAPDYFARRADGSGVVIDVRADDRIEARDAEAFEATAAACALAGWGFRRVGALEPVFAANLRWLAGYRHPRCLREPAASRLRDAFAAVRPLFEGVGLAGDLLGVLPVAYHQLWRQVLVADLHAALLGPGTLVAVGGGGR